MADPGRDTECSHYVNISDFMGQVYWHLCQGPWWKRIRSLEFYPYKILTLIILIQSCEDLIN